MNNNGRVVVKCVLSIEVAAATEPGNHCRLARSTLWIIFNTKDVNTTECIRNIKFMEHDSLDLCEKSIDEC